ncbi:MAG: transporter associated domain-containing protein [Alphaproteobacteria bacterium]
MKRSLFKVFSSENKINEGDTAIETADIDFDDHEQEIVKNLLELRKYTAEDIMIPKADIVAVEVEDNLDNVATKFTTSGYRRLPVYRETLDDAVGLVWSNDILAWRNNEPNCPKELSQMVRPILFVSPFMKALELLLEMRFSNRHMALVVDEFGGVGGLITLEDLIEEIVGEIHDANNNNNQTFFRFKGSKLPELHARLPLIDLEHHVGSFLQEDEREDIDTVGGLIFSLAGRIPAKGEIITHPSGLEFEVIGVDPRKIHWVRLMGEINGEDIRFNADETPNI